MDASILDIIVGEHRPGQHDDALIGAVGEFENIVFEPHPEFLRLSEGIHLGGGVRGDEGVEVGGPRVIAPEPSPHSPPCLANTNKVGL